MSQIYGFNNLRVAQKLDRIGRNFEPEHNAGLSLPGNMPARGIFVMKSPSGGIPAAVEDGSGNLTPGTADCDLYYYNTTTGKYEPKQDEGMSTIQFTVDNISQTAVASMKFIQVKREITGRYVIDFEDCT